jgi:tetraacyldisaccharide 4'-kinase
MTGDELYMISEELLKNYNSFWVVADKDRVKGCEFLETEFKPDVIILDDAFQNRKIKRDFDILLVDSGNFDKYSHKFLIPSGDLRESKKGIERASVIIQNNKSSEIPALDELKHYEKPIITMTYKWEGIYDSDNNSVETLPKKIIALSGIASPDSFHSILKSLDLTLSDCFVFSDHYVYINKDIRNIKERSEEGLPIVTTHKDFVKLKEFKNFIDDFNVYYLKIGLNFEDNNDILDKMLNNLVEKQ